MKSRLWKELEDIYTTAITYNDKQNKQIQTLQERIATLEKENQELKEKLNKLLKFTLSYVECCDVCPETKTCHNSEGVCPYASILQQDEDKVIQDWLLEYLSKKE